MEYVCEEQKINAKPDMISKVEWIQKEYNRTVGSAYKNSTVQ